MVRIMGIMDTTSIGMVHLGMAAPLAPATISLCDAAPLALVVPSVKVEKAPVSSGVATSSMHCWNSCRSDQCTAMR